MRRAMAQLVNNCARSFGSVGLPSGDGSRHHLRKHDHFDISPSGAALSSVLSGSAYTHRTMCTLMLVADQQVVRHAMLRRVVLLRLQRGNCLKVWQWSTSSDRLSGATVSSERIPGYE
jgi:hypothetical protein